MKQLYKTFQNRQYKRTLLAAAIFLFPCLLHAQINKVTLTNIQACGGATLIPNCFYTGGATPVTVYYERLVGADTWQLEGTQQYDPQTSYVQYNGTDLLQATTFRVRALDEITNKIYISNSVSVDPAKWNVDRGTSFATAFAYWGSNCTNGYIAISIYRETNGRPPYTIEYKKNTESTYRQAGETLGYFQIDNIDAGTSYNIRITDKCGKVSNLGAALSMAASADVTRTTTTCSGSDGEITVSASSDIRYSGVAPFTYSVHKYGSTGADTTYKTGNVFGGLSAGTYEYGVRDACGHAYIKTLTLGAQPPEATASYRINASDSCYNDIIIHVTKGTGPFTYGVKPYGGSYTYSTDSVIKVSGLGYYYYTVTDSCNSKSYEKQVYVTTNNINIIDSTKWLGTGCVNDLKIFTSGQLAPYTFYLRNYRSNSFQFTQPSDTFHNITAGEEWELEVADRCGRTLQYVDVKPLTMSCYITADTGTFESKNSQVGCANIAGRDWIDIRNDDGRLIYSINPNGNTIGNVCWGVHIEENEGTPPRSGNITGTPTYFLDRNFYIEPPANITLVDSVSVRLYITSVEVYRLTEYMASLGQSFTLTDLKILKKKGSSSSPVDLYVTDDSTANTSQFTVITPTIVPYSPGVYYMEFKVKDFSEFNPYMGSLVILPLQLLSFDGKTVNNSVSLTWKTTNEVNTKRFAVQWSATGQSFTTIGFVNAKGSGSNSYTFTHAALAEAGGYYRLQMMDNDGKFTYSKTIHIEMPANLHIVPAPNPVHDKLVVRLPANSRFTSLAVYDATGKKIMQKSISSSATQTELDVQHLANGLYRIFLQGDKPASASFVKY